VRALIESQVAALDDASARVLETASAAAVAFSVLEVAAGADLEPARVEDLCDALARRSRFLRRAGVDECPTAHRGATRSRTLQREVLYERLRAAQRASTHRAIAQRLESGWQAQPARVAATVAQHDRGREPALALAHYAAAIGTPRIASRASRPAPGPSARSRSCRRYRRGRDTAGCGALRALVGALGHAQRARRGSRGAAAPLRDAVRAHRRA
jgi:hypothetical protein